MFDNDIQQFRVQMPKKRKSYHNVERESQVNQSGFTDLRFSVITNKRTENLSRQQRIKQKHEREMLDKNNVISSPGFHMKVKRPGTSKLLTKAQQYRE